MNVMTFRKWLLVAAAAGGVAAYLQKQKQQQLASEQEIWKPVDPLRPFGPRSEEGAGEDAASDDSE